MRRSLLVTAAAAITMVLLAMLVPMAILVRSYALEDRLARAALEVQAVETVVSGQDAGAVGQYVDRLNDAEDHTQVTVLYPDGLEIGPDRGQDRLVLDARNTGRARVDDVPGGSQILVPVSRGGNSALPSQTPVVRIVVGELLHLRRSLDRRERGGPARASERLGVLGEPADRQHERPAQTVDDHQRPGEQREGEQGQEAPGDADD